MDIMLKDKQYLKGLRVGTGNLHTECFESGKAHKLVACPDGDLYQKHLRAGERLTLYPNTTPLCPHREVVYILEGTLEFQMGVYRRCIAAGTHIIGEHLPSAVTLTALSKVTFLQFSTLQAGEPVGKEQTTINTRHGSFKLLFSRNSKELMFGTVHQSRRLYLKPFEVDTNAQELYYILAGKLEMQLDDTPLILSAGDYLHTQGLTESVTCRALEEVFYLYYSTSPSFAEIDYFHNHLMQLSIEVEEKDGYTADHCRRIQTLAMRTAEVLHLNTTRRLNLSIAAFMHDIGKVKVPLDILQKPGKLNAEEWTIIKQHPSYGREILDKNKLPDAALIVEQHHERLDGSGYPKGLAGDKILTEAYIVAVADTFDAMTTDRPYRKALPVAVALEELWRYADIHYPRYVVEAFVASLAHKEEEPRL